MSSMTSAAEIARQAKQEMYERFKDAQEQFCGNIRLLLRIVINPIQLKCVIITMCIVIDLFFIISDCDFIVGSDYGEPEVNINYKTKK